MKNLAKVCACLTIIVFSILIQPTSIRATAGQWSASGSIIYYNDGKVGIGTSTPAEKLEIAGNNSANDINTLSLANIPTRNWVFINGKYTNEGNGNYPLTITQPDAAGCPTCKGDLILRPGGIISIPWVGVGIGTTNVSGYRLAVNGKVKAKEIVVTNTGWADYVFEDNYKLMSLRETESYINKNKHLPGVPLAKEIESQGISVGEMQKLQMEKIEELTLHLIEQDKKIDLLTKRLNILETRLK